MYRGTTLVSLDSKSRLAVPARYRSLLMESGGGRVVATIDVHQPCLLIYPLPEWEIIERRLARLSSLQPQERRLQRLLLGHAHEGQLDSVGRVLIASTLRQHAALERQVMVVGQLNKLEVWDQQAWYQQIEQDIAAERQDCLPLSQRLEGFLL